MFRKHKWGWIVALFITLSLSAGFFLMRGNENGVSAESDLGETAVAFVGDLAESATASGQVQAQRDIQLSLASPGTVRQLNVAVGDSVAKGDMLLQLDTAALERAVRTAEQDIAIAKANLSNLLAQPTKEEMAAAEAAVNSAQVKLESLLAGPTAADVTASQAAVDAARANIWSASGTLQAVNTMSDADIMAAEKELQEAQEAWQEVHDIWVILANCEVNEQGIHECTPKEGSERMESITEQVQSAKAEVDLKQAELDALLAPDAGLVASSQANVALATAQYEAAVARHESLLAGASDKEIAAAQADLASAQAALDDLLAEPSAADLKIAETRVAQAETGLLEAQYTLAEATLKAPFAGVVTAIHVAEGELASGTAVELFDRGSLEVVLNVDEVDVGQLAVGQPAVFTLETWPDEEISSEITAIAPGPVTNGSGLVTYNVYLAVEDTNLPLLAGMTANADLITRVGEDVLLVPNAAIAADRQQGTYSVNLIHTAADGTTEIMSADVTIGLQDRQYTQIISGLQEGDEVLLGTFAAPVQTFGGPPGNGDNNRGPGF